MRDEPDPLELVNAIESSDETLPLCVPVVSPRGLKIRQRWQTETDGPPTKSAVAALAKVIAARIRNQIKVNIAVGDARLSTAKERRSDD